MKNITIAVAVMLKKHKIAIAVSVLLAAVTAVKAEVSVDFDGAAQKAASAERVSISGSLSSFSQLASKAQELPQAAAVGIPMRVFVSAELDAMDKTITGAMLSAQKRDYTELAAGFACLLKSGTPQQKSEFVNWDAALPYSLPAACTPRAAQPQSEKGILNWVCRTVTEIIIRNVCKPDANGVMVCMNQPVTALREACKWE